MSTMTLPALMTQTVAFLLLDEAEGRLNAALNEPFDCGACKAAGTGWCETCLKLDAALDVIGPAKYHVKICRSDNKARGIVVRAMDEVADKARFGDAYDIAFFGVVAGGAR